MPPSDTTILLVALNARYTHTSLGARYLLENMGQLRAQTALQEFNINQGPAEIAAAIAACNPRIIGIGTYIWNRPIVELLLPRLRELLPDATIILGGPEISHDTGSDLAQRSDCIICGEADHTFATACRDMLEGEPVPRVIHSTAPDLTPLVLPYGAFTPHDLAHRAIYIESSRGCPHHCAFCLSSLDHGVRHLPEPQLHEALIGLIRGGVHNLRFVDRSFNLGGPRACRLLDLLLTQLEDTTFCVHLELTPDELLPSIRSRLAQFPKGSLHVEVGIQTLDAEVSARAGRPMDPGRVKEGVEFLTQETQAAVHADLIAGLPGETPDSFIAGFDALHGWGPHEIQVGILKSLHGTPIQRNATTLGLRFNATPPYNILETETMPAPFIDTVVRFAAHWERLVNRGHLPRTMSSLLDALPSAWHGFNALSQQLAGTHGLHGIDLLDICRELLTFIPAHTSITRAETRKLLRDDYLADGRRINLPGFLQDS